MKLLGWMHRKLRQNNNEQTKEFIIGTSSYNSVPATTKYTQNATFSFAGFEPMRTGEDDMETEEMGYQYHGIFAIGTLGFDPALTEPEKQTFAFSVENVTENETEVTEKDLKLINEELEKVLNTDAAKEDKCINSSGRTSHVSNVLKLNEEDAGMNESNVCPLQGYLFGSPIEFQQTTRIKEGRTSLGELLQKSKVVEQKGQDEEKKEDKNVKKTPKRQKLKNYICIGATGDSITTHPKLNKILKMFHRKVHPESSSAFPKKSVKSNKKEQKNIFCYDNGGNKHEDDTMIVSQEEGSYDSSRSYSTHTNTPPFTFGNSDCSGNEGYWIKTDSDYLVLEL